MAIRWRPSSEKTCPVIVERACWRCEVPSRDSCHRNRSRNRVAIQCGGPLRESQNLALRKPYGIE
jgi:hypothetical protein